MLDNYINDIRNVIESVILDVLPCSELKEFVLSGSKMIRSKLGITYILANDKNINNACLNILAAGELIHNASLLHDDVIDQAATRRNKQTISQKFNAQISILSGDYLVTCAVKLLLKLNNTEVLTIFNNAIETMSKAEIHQYLNRGKITSKEDYIGICRGKTAALFSAILESCSLVCEIPREISYKFAELFGLTFQIKNDLSVKSSVEDKKNRVYTTVDVLGIENTKYLLDNNLESMKVIIKNFPNKIWSEKLEDLILGL